MEIIKKWQSKLFVLVCVLTLFLSNTKACSAKLLPRYQKTAKTVSTVSSGIIVTASLRGDRRALNVYFNNLSKAKNVSYTLIYQSSGVDKGVSGSIDLSIGNSTSRELVFGTASSGVYHYDTGITGARLEIVTGLQSGKKTLKKFRIKV